MSLEFKTIEYKDSSRNGLFAGFSTLAFVLVFIGLIFSLFTNQTSVGAIDNLDRLIVTTSLDIKPKDKIEIKQNKYKAENNQGKTIRKENILNIIETPKDIPPISTEKPTGKQRPVEIPFDIGEAEINRNTGFSSENNPNGSGIGDSEINNNSETNKGQEPVIVIPTPKIVVVEKPKPKPPVSTILNSKAISLPKPNYSATAIAVGAKGIVSVTVKINKQGSVISAIATSGHTLLRPESERAAKNAKFSPTILNGEAIEVTGIIIYNFVR